MLPSAEQSLDFDQMIEALEALTTVSQPAELRRLLADRPLLLEPSLDSFLSQLLRHTWEHNDPAGACSSLACRTFLRRCRQEGVEPVLAAPPALPLPRHNPLGQLLLSSGEQVDLSQRANLVGQALAQVEPGSEPQLWATLQRERADCLAQSQGPGRAADIEAALASYEAAWQVWGKESPTPQHADQWAQTLHNMATTLRRRPAGARAENVERAIELYRQALTVRTREADRWGWAATQHHLGQAWQERPQGDKAQNMGQASRCYREALTVRQRQVSPGWWSETMQALALTYLAKPGSEQAGQRETALELGQAAITASALAWGRNQTTLGNIYALRLQGDRSANHEQAIGHYQEALQVLRPRDQPDDWALAQYNLAVAYRHRPAGQKMANLAQARHHYQQALTVYTEPTYPWEWAHVQSGLGNLYCQPELEERQSHLSQAVDCYQAALTVRTRQHDPLGWATIQNNLGNAYADLGQIAGQQGQSSQQVEYQEQALECYQLALTERTQAATPARWAETMNNIGTVYSERRKGDPAKNRRAAENHLAQALTLDEQLLLPHDARRAARNLGHLHFESQQWSQAAQRYQQALASAETLYQAALFRQSKEAELAETGPLAHRLAYALASEGDLPEAVVALEHGRARLLSEALARDRAELERLESLAPTAYQRYNVAVNQMQLLEAQELGQQPHSPQSDARESIKAARAELAASVAAIRQVPSYADFLQRPTYTDIAQAAQINPLVYITATPAGGLALIVQPRPASGQYETTVTPVWCPALSTEAVGQQVSTYLAAYSSWLQQPQESGPRQAWLEQLETTTGWLGHTLMTELVERLQTAGIEQASLIATGSLALLPLHAAWRGPADKTAPALPLSERRYALEQVALGYVPSARALSHAWQVAKELAGQTLFVVADPDGNLPHSAQEVAAVSQHFPEPWLVRGSKATRNTARQALTDCDVYHFCCHGRNVWAEPLDSGLGLAGRMELTVRDLLALPRAHRARLACLSACETGLIGTSLPDEMVGLATAFVEIGTAGVISTLWSVEDKSTAALIARFYTNWRQEGLSPLRALVTAQQELRDHAGNGPWAHPYYWAGFMLTGL